MSNRSIFESNNSGENFGYRKETRCYDTCQYTGGCNEPTARSSGKYCKDKSHAPHWHMNPLSARQETALDKLKTRTMRERYPKA